MIKSEFHIEKSRDSKETEALKEMHKIVLQHLIIRNGNVILDIACGLGIFLESITNPHVVKIGIDKDPECVELCWKFVKQANTRFRIADAQKLPFPRNNFDVVTAICVLEHVDNPTALIREAYRVCKKGGTGVFVTPNLGRPLRVMKAIKRQQKWTRSGHKQGWDYHLLKLCLQNNGWHIEKIITRFVDCPFYYSLPKLIGDFLSHKILHKLFPRVGSELYAFCKKP